MEKQIIQAPMPHNEFGGGPKIKVHYMRLHMGEESDRMREQSRGMVKSLQNMVDMCVKMRRLQKASVNPPRQLPDYAEGYMQDTYTTANREITYTRIYRAELNDDCSLKERDDYTAVLSSQAGKCEIDLTERKAEGECDAAVHARSPVVPRAPGAVTIQQQIAALKANPRTAAVAAQVERMAGSSGPTGRTKVIAGVKCEEANGGKPGDLTCRALGGSFRPYTELFVETNEGGYPVAKAREARFDAMVGADVFAPHQRGGFRINPRSDE
ncbi:hypothetical protein G4G28_09830 [Massilia sp. Dwa41.01b]|uniref:hypothetical protein n=1 Tax=unclassified Massilia TaxID=2609279 RepID=UPI001602FFC1|nr:MULTISPECIES: hypothetical protein [unclassified Massilia]QNA88717.1 hypothetical protein G4G28_09830 [Massilia sp. Dwa41.01b]QNA99616.1 hypothetical protein G4G31_13505 [Massilia sp. Se16.2.3]